MAKTNFTKVEEALNEGLRKITVNKLLDSADAASGKGTKASPQQEVSVQRQLLIALQHDLKQLHKQVPDIYEKVHITQAKLKRFLSHADQMSPQDWEEIKKIKNECDKQKQEQIKKDSLPKDEDLITKERRKHINKRFNVNEKWLPLR